MGGSQPIYQPIQPEESEQWSHRAPTARRSAHRPRTSHQLIIHQAPESEKRPGFELIRPEARALKLDENYQMFAGRRGSERAARIESLLAAGQWLRLVVDGEPYDMLNYPINCPRSQMEVPALQSE